MQRIINIFPYLLLLSLIVAQNPNPFNPLTTIEYDLAKQSYVSLILYDIMGREVIKLVNQEMLPGYHSIIWNTRNNLGFPVSAGVYFYQLQTKDFVKTRKMILLK